MLLPAKWLLRRSAQRGTGAVAATSDGLVMSAALMCSCSDVITDDGAMDEDDGEDELEEDGDDEPEDWWSYWQDPSDDAPDDGHEKPLRMTAKEKVSTWHHVPREPWTPETQAWRSFCRHCCLWVSAV